MHPFLIACKQLNFYCNLNFKLMPRVDIFINLLRHYAEK
jgi:hypothetical protein